MLVVFFQASGVVYTLVNANQERNFEVKASLPTPKQENEGAQVLRFLAFLLAAGGRCLMVALTVLGTA